MKTIQPFIDFGFYTVPLKGSLKRLEDGSKTTPIFEKDWKNYYQLNLNEIATAIGGTLTGAISGIIAIDCDDQKTYDLFCGLDPTYAFRFVSKGKPSGGGTIIYRYPQGSILESFSIQSSLIKLDFYSDNGFIYLPTESNETKEPWTVSSFEDFPALNPAPETVITLLNTLQYQYTLAKGSSNEESRLRPTVRANYLAPQLELFTQKRKFLPSLFKVLTPKDFRSLAQYVKHGYLHPNNVPDGRGSEYMSKISAILGADPSVSAELYVEVMNLINALWDFPIEQKRFEQTVIEPMVRGKAKINGESIWVHDEHWQTRGIAFTTKLGDAAEIFYDDIRGCYYFINYTKDIMKVFTREGDLFGYIEPIAVALPSRKDMKTMCPVVRTGVYPHLQFGFFNEDDYTRQFNLFRQTPALAILNNPEPYAQYYKRPETIINFFQSLIPDAVMRNYVLGFIKRKLTSFSYSPAILYFLGAHGSGKDTFVGIISHILGSNYIARPTGKEFLEQFNGWLVDKYFIQLDEYGNQLQTLSDKQEALGKIKAYSGKPEVQIRQMRTDGFNYRHGATIIMTANSNPLMLEDGDRRIALIDTPTVLKDEDWVISMGGTTPVIEKIIAEINDFCYYLATEGPSINWNQYMQPPDTEQKRGIIAAKLPAAQRIGYYLKHSMFEDLEDIVEEANLPNLLNHAPEGRIYEEDLFDLYSFMTEGRGTKRGLAKVLREFDFEKVPTSKGGEKRWYFHIHTLSHYKPKIEFHDETTVIEVSGL